MKSSACQFRGLDQTMSAYIANDVPTWALKNGPNQLLFKYDGVDESEGSQALAACLKMLQKGGSAAVYTLCVYDDWKKGGKIKNNTPYDNSFNFCLYEDEEDRPYNQRKAAYQAEYDERLTRMEAMIKNLSEPQEEEEEKVSGFHQMLAGFLSHPQIQQAIAGKVVGFIESFSPMSTIGKVAGVPAEELQERDFQENKRDPQQDDEDELFEDAWNSISEEDRRKVSRSIRILLGSDKDFPDHVAKLADMSINNKSTYNMALKFL